MAREPIVCSAADGESGNALPAVPADAPAAVDAGDMEALAMARRRLTASGP
jgi:hypothetical protein